jgi:hypothetical protein
MSQSDDKSKIENDSNARRASGTLIAQESPGEFLADVAFRAAVAAAGATAAAVYAAWEAGAESRRQVGQWVEQGLRDIGQYSQERVEAVERFISEKSLERKEPGRPTPENTNGEFQPPKKGATTGHVQEGPYAGKEGWVDSQGRILVPTNGRAAHGGEHYDRMYPDGSGHDNLYSPGGHVRSSLDLPPVALVDPDLRRQADQLSRSMGSLGVEFNGRENDVVAALMVAGTKTGFDPKADTAVMQSNKDSGSLIAVQGSGPSALRADPVSVSSVLQNSAETVFAELNKQTNTQQVASNTVDPVEQNNPTRGGRGMA